MIGKVTNADPRGDLEDYRYILHHFEYPLTDICKEGKNAKLNSFRLIT